MAPELGSCMKRYKGRDTSLGLGESWVRGRVGTPLRATPVDAGRRTDTKTRDLPVQGNLSVHGGR